MNIKEAYAKATPGPLVEGAASVPGEIEFFAEGQQGVVCTVWKDEYAALLAHAYNHLPKVLEGYATVLDAYKKGGPDACRIIIKAHEELIAEASEVQT